MSADENVDESVDENSETDNKPAKRLVILISGSGTNLQAMIDAIQNNSITNSEIVAVISNRPDVGGLARAEAAGITNLVVDHTQFSDREAYDQQLVDTIQQFKPDFIVLAGFMRILTAHFIETFLGKTVNIHPSLLPKHKGLHTHRAVYRERDEKHGCSVHFVTLNLDSGPIIGQAHFEVSKDVFAMDECDAIESLRQKVQVLEHQLYPDCVQRLVEDRLTWDQERGLVLLDGAPIDSHQ